MKTAQELLVDVIKQTSGRWFGIVHDNSFIYRYQPSGTLEQTKLVKTCKLTSSIYPETICLREFATGREMFFHPTELLAANIDGKTYDLRNDG